MGIKVTVDLKVNVDLKGECMDLKVNKGKRDTKGPGTILEKKLSWKWVHLVPTGEHLRL
jgi:hypothetical protein